MGDRPNISDIFDHARQISSPAEREVYLNAACRGDAAAHARVVALLAADKRAGDFLKITLESDAQSASGSGSPLFSTGITSEHHSLVSMAEGPGSIIGSYKLLQLIGEGGFGSVYLAEQERPVRRKVALKIIKLGMDTRQTLARFEAERQALAMMEHPNIARVLDAGATDTGRPYFVMELVRGKPITEYCDSNCLTPDERLRLFVSVCQAVQHAHQKGVIHRDIKPNNVLVSRHDETPVVKIIDFGIAKATNAQLTEKTVFTEFHQMIGTPAYMSPEQAGLSDLDVDTRSDVYSLGVLLYELLTGATPFDVKSLMSAGYAEIQRIIREVDPPRPSTRLSTMKDVLPGIAASRKIEPARLTKLVRGDLDWIVMKCLEKDRSRRYETANALGMDVSRYLSAEPIAAAPPSNAYQVQKFVRRHRLAVLAGATMVFALTMGLVLSLSGYFVANRARVRAQTAESAERDARMTAETERHRADAKAEELRQELYVARIQRIQHVIEAGGYEPVSPLLAACDEDLRGWEWNWLQRLADQSESTLKAHERNPGARGSIAFSADARRFLTTGDNGLLRIWDSHSQRILQELRDPELPCNITDAVFAADGQFVVTGSWFGRLRIWNLNSGEIERSFQTDNANLCSVAISPDGSLIAAGTWFGPTVVWDRKSGHRIHSIEKPADRGEALQFSADGSRLLVGSLGNMVSLIDMKSGESVFCELGAGFVVWDAVFSPDETKIASIGQDARLWLRDANTGKLIFSVSTGMGNIKKLAFNPHDNSIAIAGVEGTIRFFDADDGEQIGSLLGHEAQIGDFSFSPRDPTLLSYDINGNVKCWHLGCIPAQQQTNARRGLHSVNFMHDNRTMCVAGLGKNLAIYSASSVETVQEVQSPFYTILRTEVSRNGRYIAATGYYTEDSNQGWHVAIFDNQLRLQKEWPCIEFAALALSDDGHWFVSSEAENGVVLRDTQSFEPVVQARVAGHQIVQAAFSTDSAVLILGDESGGIHVANVDTGLVVRSINAHPGRITDIDVCNEFGTVATAGENDDKIRIWDWRSGGLIRAIHAALGIKSLDISPDDRRLIAGGDDMALRMWDFQTGRFILSIGHHTQAIESVTFSRDGHSIASGSLDHTLKLWETTRPSIDDLAARYRKEIDKRKLRRATILESKPD